VAQHGIQDGDDDKVFVPYPSLKEYGIPYCRVHLNRLITTGRFSSPVQLSPGRIAWVRGDIKRWIASRPLEREVA
jgi:hypothetical protein